MTSSIYNGTVIHKRFKPKIHFFKYKVFSLLIDLSELNFLDKNIIFFSYNKFNLISFFDKDHGERNGTSLIEWVKKNLKENDAEIIFMNIINNELENGLDQKIYENAKKEFISKIKSVNWKKFHSENPFKDSGLALYKWSPIADELKVLDKEIVLNSIKLKWNLVENEFKDLSKNLSFN